MTGAKCYGRGCNKRDTCKRFTSPADAAQFYTTEEYSPFGGCVNYWQGKAESTIKPPTERVTCDGHKCGKSFQTGQMQSDMGLTLCHDCWARHAESVAR